MTTPTVKTPDEIAERIVVDWPEPYRPSVLIAAIAAAITAERQRAEKLKIACDELVEGYKEKATAVDKLTERAEKAEAERDKARDYAAEVRLREKAAEDARVSAVDRAATARADALREAAKAASRHAAGGDDIADEILALIENPPPGA